MGVAAVAGRGGLRLHTFGNPATNEAATAKSDAPWNYVVHFLRPGDGKFTATGPLAP